MSPRPSTPSHRGIGPDLHVVVTASAATSPPVGSELDFFVTVSSKNVGSVSDVRLNLTLPAGYTVTHTYADRGPGCTGAASNLTCDVALHHRGHGYARADLRRGRSRGRAGHHGDGHPEPGDRARFV
jgi:hypothetical protein